MPATYHRTHGITYFHGCYSVGDDLLWGVNRRRKGIDHTWAALKSIRAARPDGAKVDPSMPSMVEAGAMVFAWKVLLDLARTGP